jgi:hypothetical protein
MMPPCADIEHEVDDPSDMPRAVALVPLISFGSTEPYAWMLACENCLRYWRQDNPGVAFLDLKHNPNVR